MAIRLGLWLLMIVGSKVQASDMFSSIAELEQLYVKEQQVAELLEKYLVQARKTVDSAEQYLDELDEIRAANLEPGGVISNPINAYHLMRRSTILWSEIKEELDRQNNSNDVLEAIRKVSESFPTLEDLSGAAFSLAQLQGAYQLNVSQLASGYVRMSNRSKAFPSVRGLTARDCLFIGKHAFNKGLYDQAIEWISTAMQVARTEGNSTASVSEIKPFLATAIRIHDDVLVKKGNLGKDWRTRNEPHDPHQLSTFRRANRSSRPAVDPAVDASGLVTAKSPEWVELEVFFKLCRGERMRPAAIEKLLRCRYISHTHRYFTLAPLKLEEHSLSPYIVAFHDFMSDRETEIFKSLAVDRLERSAHAGKRVAVQTSDKRTSKQSWIEDSEHPVVDKISRRISNVVRLSSDPKDIGSELYQVANYGIGGRYTPHTDHGLLSTILLSPNPMQASPFEQFRGDRIATFMTYLDDVEAGGATVFTHAGVTVWPKKGTAVLWWNLRADLSGDVSTRHGGCPVLHGSKWICNKWFHSGEQLFKRPCSTRREARIVYP